jgi:phosphopantetheinyl transferase (holo-ACP synthase)
MNLGTLTAEILNDFPESEFKIWQQEAWSQNSSNYRENIRQFILTLPGLSAEKDLILNLEKPLVKASSAQKSLSKIEGEKAGSENLSIDQNSRLNFFSISHSMQSGVIAQSLIPVGIDLESSARVSEKIVARVSTPTELQEAPSAAHLWTAKEACYKALIHFQQPQTVSQIEITDWSKGSSDTFSFGLKHKNNFSVSSCRGFVFSHYSEALAVFFAKP